MLVDQLRLVKVQILENDRLIRTNGLVAIAALAIADAQKPQQQTY